MPKKCAVCEVAIKESYAFPSLCSKCLHKAYKVGTHILLMNKELKKQQD
jgi:hypothetical protein